MAVRLPATELLNDTLALLRRNLFLPPSDPTKTNTELRFT